MSPGCIVSDVGSVKAEIVREMERLLPPDIPFVAGHPIAGGEQWGARAAKADLFVGLSLHFDADEANRCHRAEENRFAVA